MRIERHVVARKTQWLVAFPASVRAHLALSPGQAVYWHIEAKGRVILTTSGAVRGGRPRASADCPSCAAKDTEIARLRARDVVRERTLYAEGYSAGGIAQYERLLHPHGASANLERRRRLAALRLPDSEATAARRRRRKAASAREQPAGPDAARRQTVEVPAPILE